MNSLVSLGAMLQTHMNSILTLLFPFPLQGIQRGSNPSIVGAAATPQLSWPGSRAARGFSRFRATARAPRILNSGHTSLISDLMKSRAEGPQISLNREKKLRTEGS